MCRHVYLYRGGRGYACIDIYICAKVPLSLCFYSHESLTKCTAHHILIKLEASEPQSSSVLSSVPCHPAQYEGNCHRWPCQGL